MSRLSAVLVGAVVALVFRVRQLAGMVTDLENDQRRALEALERAHARRLEALERTAARPSSPVTRHRTGW